MAFHFIVQFEPLPGRADEFRRELLRVVEPTRSEQGCLAMHVFETFEHPPVFAIHSEWVDEAAFDLHAEMPHTRRFVEAAERLLGRPIKGLRTRELGLLRTSNS